MQRLRSLGLTQPILSLVTPQEIEHNALGRVMFESHTHCIVACEDGDQRARIHPSLRDDDDRIVVGDFVILDRSADPYFIVRRLQRNNQLARRDPDIGVQVLCANIDVIFIATALDRDLNERRLERYLAVAADADIPAVLLVTKCDLEPERIGEVIALYGARFTSVIAVSSLDGRGLDAVRAAVPSGKTAALLGSSGVGKTTLVNALTGSMLDTGPIREDDSRGRHTTTSRRVLMLPGAGLLVDNPGLRAVGPVTDAGLSAIFADIEALTLQCRFRDCYHSSEPGCAVQAAIEEGTLDEARWGSYLKLQREIAYETRRRDKDAERKERARWKRVQRDARERTRLKYGGE